MLSERFNKRLGAFWGHQRPHESGNGRSAWQKKTTKRESKCSITSDESDGWVFLWQICPTSCNFMQFSLTILKKKKQGVKDRRRYRRGPHARFFFFFFASAPVLSAWWIMKRKGAHTLSASYQARTKLQIDRQIEGKKKTRANKFKLFKKKIGTRRVWRELRHRKKRGKYRLNKERGKGIGVFLCEHKHQRLCLLNLFN